MIKLRQTLILLYLLLFTVVLHAQTSTVTGTVTDNGGLPLAGVTVGIKGKKAFVTATGTTGKFTVTTANSSTDVLVFSYIGFQKQEFKLNGQSNIAVTLQLGNGNLSEVVVVGYGTQKRANLTGAVSTIKADVLSDRPITDASQALSGTASGVWVNQSSGQPGSSGATIQIRGVGTLGNSAPLVIVDGLISSMSNVNPSDIATITVLKDAASAAIYGSRAANGVVLIQTKKGKKGTPQFDFTTSFGSQSATDLPQQVTNSVQYMNLYNQALANQGQPAFFSPATISQYQAGKDPLIYPNNDWFKMIFKPAMINDNNLKISGGTDATQYLVSLGFLNQDGIVKNDNAKRYSALVNLNSRITKAVDFGVNLNLIHQTQNQSWYGNSNSMISEVMRALPMYGTYTSTGQYAGTWVNVINAQINNPYAMVDEGLNQGIGNNMQGSGFFNVEPIKGLKWNVTGGINYGDGQGTTFNPLIYVFNPLTGAQQNQVGNGPPSRSLTDKYNNNMRTTLYSTLSYTKTIATDHNITALLGYNQEQYNERSFQSYIEGFQTNSLTELNAGSTNPQVAGTSAAYAIRSYFGRVNYAFKDKYLLEANARYDGSSRFASSRRWGFFPSFSAGWRVIEESFMKDQNIFSNLKLRASWGKLGNDQLVDRSGNPIYYGYIPTLSLGTIYDFNSQIAGGVAQTILANPNITWETSTKKDAGVEMGFLQNKLSVEVDYFDEQRSNILQTLGIPWIIGNLTPPPVNLASVNNKGWEINTNYAQNIGKVKFNVGFNLTHIRNKVSDVLAPQYNGNNVIENGQPINAFYMVKALGIFKTQQEVDNSAKPATNATAPGDIKYQDISGPNGKPDGIIDANDRQIVGKPIPTWTYGANLSAAYHGVDLSVLLQGVGDVQSYVGGNLYFPFFNGAGITTNWVGNTWTPTQTNAPLPRLLQYNAPTNNYMASSFWLQNASYTRIKNIQLGYTIPQSISEKIKLKYVRFYVNAQNPFTFTKFQGLDPESAVGGSQYPNMKVFTGGVTVRF
ncbi:SusC/RagA family TonB-linked outer membrane protein [Mucilaginibacter sp. SP1R1]|uniref:SusC/RagA family TonB-linked outer membrane protein n=1 Tax=Mucilaginibacter sp. SP1R1 TaxID=2723091 RepID=UPI00160C133C|nr:TonB-dependent receptor [Mucilaginibacter sp. SP1R1]MBB6151105.1 TonB-linked SusC/RagA family outer membrane protein [Mucilaginibacter sp. SP1R1]